MQRTWVFLAISFSFSPTFVAVRPPMPLSISSKTAQGFVRSGRDFRASIRRDSSPPEAILLMGLGGFAGVW